MFNLVSRFLPRQRVVGALSVLLLPCAGICAHGDTRPNLVIDRLDDDLASGNACTPAPNDCTLRGALNAHSHAVWNPQGYANIDTHLITFDPQVFAAKQVIHFEGFFPVIHDALSIIGPSSPGTGVTIQTDTRTPYNNEWLIDKGPVLFENLTIRNNGERSIGVIAASDDDVVFQNCTFQSAGKESIGLLGAALIRNCTFVGFDKYALYAEPNTLIENCTIVGNRCGILSTDKINLSNSIVVGNRERNLWTTSTDGKDVVNDLNNIITGTPAQAGLEVNADGEPILTDNGGPTATIALVPGGYAVGRGKSNLKTDQRGQLRSQTGKTDIGAFELSKLSRNSS